MTKKNKERRNNVSVELRETKIEEVIYRGKLHQIKRFSAKLGKDDPKELIVFSSSDDYPDSMFSLDYESAKMLLRYSLGTFSQICSQAGKNPKAEFAEVLFE